MAPPQGQESHPAYTAENRAGMQDTVQHQPKYHSLMHIGLAGLGADKGAQTLFPAKDKTRVARLLLSVHRRIHSVLVA